MNNLIFLVVIIWLALGAIAVLVLSYKRNELYQFGLNTPKEAVPVEIVFFLFFLFPSQVKILNKARREFLDKWIKRQRD